MKLKLLLEGDFDPRRLLLHVQQLIVDEYQHADVDINVLQTNFYELSIKYFDITSVKLELYRDDGRDSWAIALKSLSGGYSAPSTFHGHQMTALNIFNALDKLLKADFEMMVEFEDGCRQQLISDDETWVFAEIATLFKYLDTGRLKKASDVHVVIAASGLEDEGLQKLETRYNSMYINSKKLPNRHAVSSPHPSDAKAVGREVYIFAALE